MGRSPRVSGGSIFEDDIGNQRDMIGGFLNCSYVIVADSEGKVRMLKQRNKPLRESPLELKELIDLFSNILVKHIFVGDGPPLFAKSLINQIEETINEAINPYIKENEKNK